MAAESLARIHVAGAQIGYRRIGKGRPLLVLNGFAATSADWDPSFIDGLASYNELILVDHRGIGGSPDDGKPFDIAQLADDAARVIEALGFERISVLGWSMGGFIAQTLALENPVRVNKLVLLSTDPGGADADLPRAPCGHSSSTCPARLTSRRVGCCRCFFRAMSPSPSTANTATSWRLRVRSYLLTSSTARRRQWTRGTEMVWGGACEILARKRLSPRAMRTS